VPSEQQDEHYTDRVCSVCDEIVDEYLQPGESHLTGGRLDRHYRTCNPEDDQRVYVHHVEF